MAKNCNPSNINEETATVLLERYRLNKEGKVAFCIPPAVYKETMYDENGNPVEGITEGEIVEVEKPGYVTVILPITAEATVEEDGYYVNGFKICVGGLIYIRTPDFAGAGHVISINVIEGGASK